MALLRHMICLVSEVHCYSIHLDDWLIQLPNFTSYISHFTGDDGTPLQAAVTLRLTISSLGWGTHAAPIRY